MGEFTPARALLAAASVLAFSAPQTAVAQSDGVEEVVVTAQRRAESLQEVPVAVTVVTGEQLAQRQIFSAESLGQLAPSITFRKGTTNVNSAINIRGVGTIAFASGVEPGVSTVLDGVVLARSGQATLDFLDLERLEVLRGPQGTLFGKNSSAGVVNLVTRRPSAALTGFAEGAYFEGGESRLRVGVSGPLSASLRGSLAGLYGEYDGNGRNLYDNSRINGYERVGARGKLEWSPSDDLVVTLIGDHLNEINNGYADVIGGPLSASSTIAAQIAPVDPRSDNFDINNDFSPVTKDSNSGLSLQADWTVGGYTLTSISAFRDWGNTEYRDGDFTAGASGTDSRDVGVIDFTQVTQELRLASPTGGLFEYVAGLYYYHTDQDNFFNRTTVTTSANTSVPSGTVAARGTANWNTQLTNYAVFGQATVNFTERFRAFAGLRWSSDEVEYDFARAASPAGAGVNASFASAGSVEEDGYTAKVGAQYDVTPKVNAYVSYARGYKGPAINVFFNMLARDIDPLESETSDAYEAGLKTKLFDDKLVLNTAAFYALYDNFQTSFYDLVGGSIVSRLINAGEISTKGVEFDLNARPTPALTLSGGLAYTDATVEEFRCPVGAPICPTGGELPYAPEWKGNVSADYLLATPGLPFDLGLNTGVSWQSEVQYDLLQQAGGIQDAYALWDAGVSLIDRDGRYRASFVVKNITDQYYTSARVANTTPNPAYWRVQVPRDAERYVGIVLRANFGS